VHYDRDAALLAFFNSSGQHAPAGTSINVSGYYAYLTWYLTGESRAASYKQYSKDPERPGTFGQIRILNPVSAGGWGAWELAARFSAIKLGQCAAVFCAVQPA